MKVDASPLNAGIDRLASEIERRLVRAAIDGVVAESAILRPGAMVQEGERLASIVAAGRLLIAAIPKTCVDVSTAPFEGRRAKTLIVIAHP